MSGNRRFTDAIKTLDFRKGDKPLYFSGMLGTIINGVSVIHIPSRPGFVWVRLRSVSNELIQAYNSLVSPIYDLPVIVERDPLDPTRYSIIGRDVGRYDSWGVANSPAYTNPVYQITYYPNFYDNGSLIASSGTIIDFGDNINVSVTGSVVFISAVDSKSLVIYDDAAYKVTGTALNFADNLSVVVTGTTAYVGVSTGIFALASHFHTQSAYDLIIYEDSTFKATGTAISFGENMNVAVTGSMVFVSSVDTGGGGGGNLVIYDDSVFKVTGTALDFGANINVAVTGSVAYIGSSIPTGSTDWTKVLLLDSGGSPVTEYTATSTGINSAGLAATSGDVILLPARSISGDISLVSGIIYRGQSRNGSILTGKITGAPNAILENLSIIRTANDDQVLIGLEAPSTGTSVVYESVILLTQSGSGDAYGMFTNVGKLVIYDSRIKAESISGSGYGAVTAGGGILDLDHTLCIGSTDQFLEI